MMNRILLLLALISGVKSSSVVKLDADNFDALTAGKTVFIKFFAPWCGHCKSMAPDWEKLADDWAGHAVGMIAEVDCTEPSGQSLCEEYGVEGFPTLMYGDPNGPEQYQGRRDYEALSDFAKENLEKVYCSVRSADTACSDEEKALIAEIRAKSKEELEAIVESAAERTKAANEKYEAALEELQATYERITSELNDENEAIRTETHLKWVNQILSLDHPEPADADPAEDEL